MVDKSPFDVDIRVGTVKEAEAFPETDKSGMCKLWIDIGDEAGGNAAASGTQNTGGVSASHEPQGGSESTDAERSVQDEEVQSCAQLLHHHEPEEIEGMQVLTATNLGSVRIAGFKSEVLTLGVPGKKDGKPVLVTPEEEVPDGGELY